jgi:hypothetical protein
MLQSQETSVCSSRHGRASDGTILPWAQREFATLCLRHGEANKGYSYLFNPLTLASCLGRPTSLFTNTVVLIAVQKAIERKNINAMMALALAAYLSMYPTLLLPPLLLLCFDQKQRDTKSAVPALAFVAQSVSVFVGSIVVLLYMSYLLTGASWEFLASTYGNHLLMADLTPNIGLWWYFFIEMFDSFREFFLGVFWLHLSSYVGGLTIRIRRQPLFVITALLGIFAMFKPYPSVSDTALYLSMLPLYGHVYPREYRRKHLRFPNTNLRRSHAVYVLRNRRSALCSVTGSSVLLSLDICWIRKRQFFLCHYSSMEPGSHGDHSRYDLGRAQGRVGSGETRDEGQVRPADIEQGTSV